MEIMILGSGTCVPYLKRSSSCIAVKIKDFLLLLDSGPGSIRRLLEAKLDYKKIDYLFYSHFHPDHTADLIPLLFAIKNTPDYTREKDLILTGPRGFKKLFDTLSSIYGKWIVSPEYTILLKEVSISKKSELFFDGFTVTSSPVLHSENSTAFRIESENKEGGTSSIVFSGDTDYCESLIELSRGTDILILECSFPDEKKVEGHLTPSLAGKIARESGCKKLVLAHLYPVCDCFDILSDCQQEYEGEIVVAEDLMRFVL
jgi:ribonuclease BN (tRNA processing enzyme)